MSGEGGRYEPRPTEESRAAAERRKAPMSLRVYTVRTVERPRIVCPSWCCVPDTQHLDELPALDGGVVHIGRCVPMLADGCFDVRLTATRLVDGTPDPDEPHVRVQFISQPDCTFTLADADVIADQLGEWIQRWRRP